MTLAQAIRGRGSRILSMLGATAFCCSTLTTPAQATAPSEVASVPSVVSGVQVVGRSASSVSLSWLPAGGNGSVVSDYVVEFSLDGVSWSVFDDGVSSGTSATVTGLTRSAWYVFRVSAVNAVGRGLPGLAGGLRQVAAGGDSACAVRGSGQVGCWGRNDFGQLGDGTTSDRSVPVVVSGVTGAVSVAVGGSHACAVDRDGVVWCWGRGDSGQLGNGSTANQSVPVRVAGLAAAVQVVAGEAFSCALLADTTVRCWGRNDYGQLGDGTTVDSASPSLTAGMRGVSQLAAGGQVGCALVEGGQVRCWGRNDLGQLGNTMTVSSAVPTGTAGVAGAVSIAVGANHGCAVLGDGTVRCWGADDLGQLGDGANTTRTSPVAVLDVAGVASIAAGGNTTCVTLVSGAMKCWGSNTFGQLGDGGSGSAGYWERTADREARWVFNPRSSNRAVDVVGVTDAALVAVGAGHACAGSVDNLIRCWGINARGQLGNGTTTAVGEGWSYGCWPWYCWGHTYLRYPYGGSWNATPAQTSGYQTLDTRTIVKAAPSSPLNVVARTGDGRITVSWGASIDDGGAFTPLTYTVTLSPGGGSCTTTDLTCTVLGLQNQVRYIVAVTASNDVGYSGASSLTRPVVPHAQGLQTWVDNAVVLPGSNYLLNVAGAVPGSTVSVSGAIKAQAVADIDGFAAFVFTPARAGVQAFAVTNVSRVGKVNVKTSVLMKTYSPRIQGPFWKVKVGKSSVWKISYAPPRSTIRVFVSDGTILSGQTDINGNATLSTSLTSAGLVAYYVQVAGVSVSTGELTVVRS